MLAAIADGDTEIEGWVPAEVCLATLRCMQALGARVEDRPGGRLVVHGHGLDGLNEPADVLHAQGLGTAIRLLSGLVAGRPIHHSLTGTDPLRRRPMGRVAEPLRLMGATVLGRDGGRLPPLTIRGRSLKGIDYTLPVASAQVKSAILGGPLRRGRNNRSRARPVRTIIPSACCAGSAQRSNPLEFTDPRDPPDWPCHSPDASD